MIAYFPNIYDDELLASAVARFHCHTMGFSYADTHRAIYGRYQHRTAINFPRNLAALFANIEPFVNKDINGLVADTTLFPYYYAFETEAVRKRITQNMIEQYDGKKAPIPVGWETVFDRLRACPACIEADIEKFGEAYWHRTHQINAVHICPRHGTPLLNAQTRYFKTKHAPLEILTEKTALSEYLPALSERSRQRLSEIASYAHGYLNGLSPTAGTLPFSEEGRTELRKLYPYHNVGLHMVRIEKDILEHFGEQCLKLLGLPLVPGHTHSWVRNMLRIPTPPMTTKHIIMKIFMDDFVRNRISHIQAAQDILDKLSARTWPCYNPAAAHQGKRLKMDVYKSKGYSRNNLIGFRCDCGYIYLAKEEGLEHTTAPVVSSVLAFGPAFVEKVRSLYAQGFNYSQIGRTLGFSDESAKNMISKDYRTRKRWSSADARAAQKAKNHAKQAKTPKARVYVDYNERDERFVQLVRETADSLYRASPPVRASRSEIGRTSGMKASHLIRLKSYPKTSAALETLSETPEEFKVRLDSWKRRQMYN